MGSRTVDVNWANEHHSLWMEEENEPHRIERDAEATNRDLGGIAIPRSAKATLSRGAGWLLGHSVLFGEAAGPALERHLPCR